MERICLCADSADDLEEGLPSQIPYVKQFYDPLNHFILSYLYK